jgi:hypothetical protein
MTRLHSRLRHNVIRLVKSACVSLFIVASEHEFVQLEVTTPSYVIALPSMRFNWRYYSASSWVAPQLCIPFQSLAPYREVGKYQS